jgi:hypothetical protein
MKYKNYEIIKDDKRNWKVTRFDNTVAPKDVKNPKTGEVVHKKGEEYVKETFLGFYSDVSCALNGIVRDTAGIGCETISDLANQITQLKEDFYRLLK